MPHPAIRFTGPLGKFTWRMLATVLAGQGISISLGALVARGIAIAGGDPRSDVFLYGGLGLAVLCLLAAGLMRTSLGLPLGWLCQALTIASAAVVPMMLIVGAIFLGLWILCLVQGARIERMVAEREATA
jgi:hypothetical protein